MSPRREELVVHKFNGGRFEDHGIDLESLTELTTYKQIVVETAKELWRAKNRDRLRLPKNFEEDIVLKFYEIRKGSVDIPIYREYSQPMLFTIPDEVDEAVGLLSQTIEAINSDNPLPIAFPKSVLPLFDNYGKTLRSDESFEITPSKTKSKARYTRQTREKLVQWTEKFYEDSVDLVGTVLMARVNKPKMALGVNEGREIEAVFPAEEEEKILHALKEHSQARVRILGKGVFNNSGTLERIIHVDRIDLLPTGELEFHSTKPIWEQFDDLTASVPSDELKKIPPDAARNIDHYLYGSRKEEE